MAVAFLTLAAGRQVFAASPGAGKTMTPAVPTAAPVHAAPKGASTAAVAGVLACAGVRSAARRRNKRTAIRYKVTLDTLSGTKMFECPEDSFILDKAMEEGLDLPYSCRAWACTSCAGKVVSGMVDQSSQAFLYQDEVEAGFVLTCVATPTSDVTIETHCEEQASQFIPGKVDKGKLEELEGGAAPDFVKFRQNCAETPERLLNQQIQMELEASHAYIAMGAYFDRADVALPGFKEWAMKQSEEEREHAEKLIKYQNLRGGDYVSMPIAEPASTSWGSALDAMKCALTMEMQVNKSLLKLHKACDAASDPQFCDFLETEFLEEQVESINEISKVIRKLIRAGPGLGEYMVDKHVEV